MKDLSRRNSNTLITKPVKNYSIKNKNYGDKKNPTYNGAVLGLTKKGTETLYNSYEEELLRQYSPREFFGQSRNYK